MENRGAYYDPQPVPDKTLAEGKPAKPLPVIYCLEEEYNEEQALKDLKASEKPGYLAVLMEMDGFDTFQECLDAVNGPEPLPQKLQTEDRTNKLMYKGKTYYFPSMIICRVPESNMFRLLFSL